MTRNICLALLAAASLLPATAVAQEKPKPTFEVYGFAQADLIQDFNRVRPDWNATLRVSRIPTQDGLYGSDGETIFSVRQSRFGVKASLPLAGSVLKGRLEFDFFGSTDGRPDAGGQNGVRLRHAYGEWGPWLAGQTHSLFMDADLWPNIIDYWGPTGMAFYRNVQLRYTPVSGKHTVAVALERPATDLDPGTVTDPVAAVSKAPDVTGQYRLTGDWGYLQVSGILRWLGYDTPGAPDGEPKGDAVGYGGAVSSVFKVLRRATLRLSVLGGAGISYYMNDGGTDLAFGGTLADPSAEAVPLLGVMAYVDVAWNERWTSSIGYASTIVDNTELQADDAYKAGHYASANLLLTPMKNVLLGPEVLWGMREDKNGADGTDVRVQVSFKYSFSSLDFARPN
jgi:hypothetical protein